MLRAVLALAVSGGALAVLLAQVDWDRAKDALSSADLGWLAASLGWSLAIVWARGQRWTLLDPRPGLGVSTAAIAVQTFTNRIAPVRLGELALPYLLRRHAGIEPSRTLILLIVVRIVELGVAIGLIALATLLRTGTRHAGWLLGLGAVLLLIVATLVFFRGAVLLFVRAGRRVASALRVADRRIVRLGFERLEQAVDAENRLTPSRRAGLLVWTVINQGMQIAVFDAVLRALGVHLDPLSVIQASSVGLTGTGLPLPSVGTVGTFEASWAAGCVWVGVPFEVGVVTGVVIQVLTLVFAALVALPSWLYLVRRSARRTR